jgi:predicted nucleotidyltransferase
MSTDSIAANTGGLPTEADALRLLVSRIVDQLDPQAIWLFGSRARNTHRPDSDFDLLVVTRVEDGELGYDYDRAYAPALGTGIGCDIIPCRLDDFEREAAAATGLVREVLDTGSPLYERQ